MPESNLGFTVSANPPFFFYVPKNTAELAEFTVFDEESKQIYQRTFALANTPGVIKVQLPQTVSWKLVKLIAGVCDNLRFSRAGPG
jgi:hypothetical protein